MTPDNAASIHPSADVDPGARIGPDTRIWHQAQVREGAVIGRECILGKDVYVDRDVTIGDRVKIQNGVSVYRGVTIGDDVFVGPHVSFTNDLFPRAFAEDWEVVATRVGRGASIGANATIVCGVTIGEYALIGAGAVVTRDIPAYGLAYGNPARVVGRVNERGHRLPERPEVYGERAERLRVAVIGAGPMGLNHLRALATLQGRVTLAGVADRDPEAARQAGERRQIRHTTDYRELLPEIDAAIVAVPTVAHFTVAASCLRAGKHVLLEKPMAATVEEADELVRLADASGVVLQVGHVERFNPATAELAATLAGAGRLIGIEARRLSPFSGRGLDIDVVADLMLHDIDIVYSLLKSPVQRCQATGIAARSERADYAVAQLVFAGGVVASFVASRTTQEKVRLLEVTADDGYYCLDFLDRKLTISRGMSARHERGVYRQEYAMEKISIPNAEPLLLEVEHFADCIRHGRRPLVDGQTGVEVLKIVTEIQKQMILA